MADLNALKDFHLVATHGGFGSASRASGRSKATLSRRVANLEESLGLRLIERGRRQLELTEAGQLLLNRTSGPIREIDESIATVQDDLAQPRGLLRISAPLLFSQIMLGRLAARFQAIYPLVNIEVVAEDRFVDLVDERFDVAIRVNPEKDSMLVGRCFAKDRLVLVAAPSIPAPKSGIGKVPAVVMPSYRQGELWSVCDGRLVVEPQPVLRSSSLLTARDAVAAGAGAAMLPESIIGDLLERGQLVSWGAARTH